LLSWSFDVLWKAGCRPVVVAGPQAHIADIEAELRGATVVESTGPRPTTMLGVLAMIATERVATLDFRHPLAAVEEVHATVEGLDQADACVGVVPVKETLKRVKEGVVVETLDRKEMWHQVMPYAFRVEALRSVYQRAGNGEEDFADDVRTIRRSGGKVMIVPVAKRNVAIVNRNDLEVANALLGSAQ
jgi:2-C-methyl-D-erythritol 4-phosphate cytidylyltransferase